MTDDPAAFELQRVSVRFGAVSALEAVDLSVARGEAVAFVGPSGAGKTTLLRLLNGTARPTSGRVLVDGRPVDTMDRATLRRLRASVGFVHQDLALVPNLRVVQNVVAGRLARMGFLRSLKEVFFPGRAAARRVHGLLERVGIPEKLYERTDRLSGGQRQRVAIARALDQQPRALLADEPVSSVDPARARDAVELLARISAEEGLTLCVSLHDRELAQACFPRLVGVRDGRIVFDRPTGGVAERDFERLYSLSALEMLADGA